MTMTSKLKSIPVLLSPDRQVQQNALQALDELRARVASGETIRFGIIECRSNGDYSTEFTSAMHKREDAAMMIDLALRMLGFVCKDKHDEFK